MESINNSWNGKRDALLAVLLVLATLACVLVAGCTQKPVSEGPIAEPPALLVDYSRSGGIAGFFDRVVIYSNGHVVYQTREGSGMFILDEVTLERLRSLIRDADVPNLNTSYPAPSPGADYFSYTLVFGNRTITTETTGVPPPLMPVIVTIDEILATHRGKQ
ncbi:MAG: hypothetical protein NQU46_07075 [Methanolinea sp.]|nr:hypothetical protein [Methanolinea sp.]